MTPAEVQEQLAAILSEVNRGGTLLVSPTPANLDKCFRILELASFQLNTLHSRLGSPAPHPGSFIQEQHLNHLLHKASVLLEKAAHFHQTWNRMLGAMCSGYEAGGAAASVVRPSRMCLEG